MKPRAPRTWRLMVFAVCSLAAGFIATVVTAVLCVSGTPGSQFNVGVVNNENRAWSVHYRKGTGRSQATMFFHTREESALDEAEQMKSMKSASATTTLKYDETLRVPGWCTAITREAEAKPSPSTPFVGVAFSVGWPVNCLYGGMFTHTGGQIDIGLYKRGNSVIPARPLPIPVALNTLFFATVLGSLYLLAARGVRSLRRKRRAGRGVCMMCGYDLQGLGGGGVCPECGAAAAVRPTPPAT